MQSVQPPPAFIRTAPQASQAPQAPQAPPPHGPPSPAIPSTGDKTPQGRAQWPHGLRMQRDFITRDHEAELVRLFREELEWPRDGKGRVSLHYGYTFSYKNFGIDEDVPFREFPGWLRPLIPLLPLREGEGDDDEDKGEVDDEGFEEQREVEGQGRDGGEVQERDSCNTPEAKHHQQRQRQRQRQRRRQRQREERRRHQALGGRPPDQVCLQYYPPGTGIPPHVDTHSTYDELYALSLGAPVLMQFRLDGVLSDSSSLSSSVSGNLKHDSIRDRDTMDVNDGNGQDGAPAQSPPPPPQPEHTDIPLPQLPPKPQRPQIDLDLLPRSMLEMSGDSRLHWTHGIKPRKTDTLTGQVFGSDLDSLDSIHSLDNDDGGTSVEAAVVPVVPVLVVRPREDRWSITYRWLRRETPARIPLPPPLREPREPREEDNEEMTRECECGDVLLCDTAQRRRGQEREYRWKQYDAAATVATETAARTVPST